MTTLSDFALWMANYDHGTVGGASLRQRMLSTSTLADGTLLGYHYGLVKEADHGGGAVDPTLGSSAGTSSYRRYSPPSYQTATSVLASHLDELRLADMVHFRVAAPSRLVRYCMPMPQRRSMILLLATWSSIACTSTPPEEDTGATGLTSVSAGSTTAQGSTTTSASEGSGMVADSG